MVLVLMSSKEVRDISDG